MINLDEILPSMVVQLEGIRQEQKQQQIQIKNIEKLLTFQLKEFNIQTKIESLEQLHADLDFFTKQWTRRDADRRLEEIKNQQTGLRRQLAELRKKK